MPLPTLKQMQSAVSEGGTARQDVFVQCVTAWVTDPPPTSDAAATKRQAYMDKVIGACLPVVAVAAETDSKKSSKKGKKPRDDETDEDDDDDDAAFESLDVLLDVLWMCVCASSGDATNDADDDTGNRRQEVVTYLLQSLHNQLDTPDASTSTIRTRVHDTILGQFPSGILHASGWLASSSADGLDKKVRTYHTNRHYKQHKFNLLAEQTEGYSKYVQLLLSLVEGESHAHASTATSTEAVLTLIGTFALDPIRCMDLIVDVVVMNATSQPTTTATAADNQSHDQTLLLGVLRSLNLLDHLPALLRFKLAHATATNNKTRRTSLFQTMVQLVRHELLNAKRMYQYFAAAESATDADDPTDATMSVIYKARYDRHRKALKELAKVRLLNSSNSGNAATATDVAQEALEVKQLQRLADSDGLHFLQAFFDAKQGALLLQPSDQTTAVLTPDEWSQLCFLLPETVGVAVCNFVQEEIQPQLPASARPPWSVTKEPTNADAMQIDDAPSRSLEDIVDTIAGPLMATKESGCIRFCPILYTQLCRFLASKLAEYDSDKENISEPVVIFIEDFLLPSLSFFPANPTVAHEVWAVLQHLPYQTRYRLYDAWRGKGLERAGLFDTNKPIWLVETEFRAGKDVRYALKRLSKDTIRDMSRAIAKVCHSHPLIVFTTILNQIESYDNLVQVMVDALRFVTPLGLDVLSSCILYRLSDSKAADGANRSRLKEDGLNVSQWLQSMESFIGYFYKQFPLVDSQGILCYLMNRLKDGHVMELGVLRSLLKTSAGWAFADYAPAASLSYNQLMGRSGSHALKRETMSFGIVEDVNQRASQEVRRVLQTDNMGVCLLILLAQVRNHIVFGKTSKTSDRPKPVKLVAYLLDSCQVTMAMLLDFLSYNESDDASVTSPIQMYAKALPTLKDLYNVYGLDGATSWMFCRPLIQEVSTILESGNDEAALGPLLAFRPTHESRVDYESMLPPSSRDYITIDLFQSFFSLSLYDIHCPDDVYEAEILRLEKEAERLAQLKAHVPVSVQPGNPPLRTEKADKERVKETLAHLASDLAKQKQHVATTRQDFVAKMQDLFQGNSSSPDAASTFLLTCIYPRCMQGPDDAMYCAHFIFLLHNENTPGFGTLHLLNFIITALSRTLFGLTEGEAANMSILLLEIWKVVSRWRYDEEAFKEQLAEKNGSFMAGADGAHAVTFKEYEDLYNKWHASLGSVIIGALNSSEYIHTRNCLILLTRTVNEFPTRPVLGYKLIKTLEPLSDEANNSFADIRASAAAYSQQLIRARDDGVWKEETAAAVEARQRKIEAAAAARQKQAQIQMEEIKRDSEKIGKELGPERDWRRGDGRGGDMRDRRPTFEHPPGRLPDGDRRGPPPMARMEDKWSSRDRGPPIEAGRMPPKDIDSRSMHPRDRPPPVRSDFATMAAADAARNTGDRFQRDGDRGGRPDVGTKRSRPASPEEGESMNRDDQPASKRSRTDGNRGRRRGGK